MMRSVDQEIQQINAAAHRMAVRLGATFIRDTDKIAAFRLYLLKRDQQS